MAIGRYDNTLKIAGGKKLASPRGHNLIYRAVQAGALSYRLHILKEGERLDILAGKYYGNGRLWWVIAAANNVGKGGLTLASGLQIRIPINVEQIQSNFVKLNKQ